MADLSHNYNSKTINLILGGGVGSRLYPLTKIRSKPAVPIAGKYRLIDIPISNCLTSGLKRIYVLTQFNSASLNSHISHSFRFDSFSDAFVDILAAEQTRTSNNWFQGTADAVRQSLPNTKHRNAEYVIILSGDQLYQMDLKKVLDAHVDNKAQITIATIPVTAESATSFGILKVDRSDKIHSFIEKPHADQLDDWTSDVPAQFKEQSKNYLASMGIYIFNKSVLDELISEKYPDATDFGKEIIPSAIEDQYQVYSYPYEGYWNDIGDIQTFFDANIALSNPDPLFNLFDKKFGIYTRPRILPPSKIFGTSLNNVLLAEGSLIYAKKITNSVIGVRSIIRDDTIIDSCYVMGNDRYEYTADTPENEILLGIGKHCVLKRAIIDKHARIGDHVSIIGDETLEDIETDDYTVRKGIIVINKRARIPDGTKIGL